MRYLLLIATLLSWLMSASETQAYYLDTPHNESNGIYCYTCHGMVGLTTATGAPTWADRALANPDDTIKNFICNSCHAENPTNQLQRGPAKKPHASSTTGATTSWSTECTQCHNVHYQGQLDWNADDYAKLYLVTGTFTSNATYSNPTPSVPGRDSTSINFTTTTVQPGFEDTSKWKSKGGSTTGSANMDASRAVDGSRGLILVPDKTNHPETFEIINVTGNTITVKGQMVRDAIPSGNFGIIYGQAIKSSVMPNGGYVANDLRDVKYFAPDLIDGTFGGYVDLTPGKTKPVGLCQVCHTATANWLKDGTGSDHQVEGDKGCQSCHDHNNGFAKPPNLPPTANPQSLTVKTNTATPLVLSGTDPEGLPLIFSIVTPPSHGVLSVINYPEDSTGIANITYSPEPGYLGQDSFAFVANDSVADSPPTTVTINVEEFMMLDRLNPSFPNESAGESGVMVDIDGDLAIVSRPYFSAYEYPNAVLGRAEIYRFNGNLWRRESILLPWAYALTLDRYILDRYISEFGSSVAISGDLAVVGASGRDLWSGERVYVYRYKPAVGRWEPEARLTAPPAIGESEWAGPRNRFGKSVAISGNRIVIGAPGENYDGAAYVYVNNGTTWELEARMAFTGARYGDWANFGSSVAIEGNTVIIGSVSSINAAYAPYSYNPFAPLGSAHIYEFNGADWVSKQIIRATDFAEDWDADQLGASVALNGDHLAISASQINGLYSPRSGSDMGSKGGRGAVFLYKKNPATGAWDFSRKITAPEQSPSSGFGFALDLSGPTMLVGSPWELAAYADENTDYYNNTGYNYLGAAYRYDLAPNGDWLQTARLSPPLQQRTMNDMVGYSVALSGDRLMLGAEYKEVYHNEFGEEGNIYTTDPDTGSTYFYSPIVTKLSLEADKAVVPPGSGIVLSWDSVNATSVNITEEIISPDDLIVQQPLAIETANHVFPGSRQITYPLNLPLGSTVVYRAKATGPAGTSWERVVNISIAYPEPVIEFTADNYEIDPGGQVTLAWNVSGADTVSIAPGGWTGSVGSQIVTPSATTTYLLTASNPAHTVTAGVTVTILPPEVTIAASPTPIGRGASTTLAWTFARADSAVISGVGAKFTNGEQTVSPTASTTYTITASGAGGSATAEVTVIVTPPPPTVSLWADPPALALGQTGLVCWKTTDSNDVSYREALSGESWGEWYQAPAEGCHEVAPVATSNYQIMAVSSYGQSSEVATVTVLAPDTLGVAITKPLAGEVINAPLVRVEGLVTNGVEEVGVTVNGIPAQVAGNIFFVNNLPLAEGTNTITAIATAPNGATAQNEITVTSDTVGKEWLELSLNPESGVADPTDIPAKPFTATLRVTPHLSNSSLEWGWDLQRHYTGTGTSQLPMTLDSSSDDGLEHQLTFNDPGVYRLYYTLTDISVANGQTYTGEFMVNVLDKGELDGMLRAKWEGMKLALSTKNIEGAISYFREPARDNYRDQFIPLSNNLPQLVANMQEIELIYLENNRAKYRINRNHVMDGISETVTYYIYFLLDEYGLWKIEQF